MKRLGIIGILEQLRRTTLDALDRVGKPVLHVDESLPVLGTRALREPLQASTGQRRDTSGLEREGRHRAWLHGLQHATKPSA